MVATLTVRKIMEKQKILVVEDNIFVRRLFEFSLTSDYQLMLAVSREDAWSQLDAQIPDIAFIDVGLDEAQGGLLLLDAMRADARFHQIPVAIVSASSLPRDVELAKERGANAYLTKPFSVLRLKELARKLLQAGATPS